MWYKKYATGLFALVVFEGALIAYFIALNLKLIPTFLFLPISPVVSLIIINMFVGLLLVASTISIVLITRRMITKHFYTKYGSFCKVSAANSLECKAIDDGLLRIKNEISYIYSLINYAKIADAFFEHISIIANELELLFNAAKIDAKTDTRCIGYTKINEALYNDILPKITAKAKELIQLAPKDNKETTYGIVFNSLSKIFEILKNNTRSQVEAITLDVLWKKHVTAVLGKEFTGKSEVTTPKSFDTDS